MNVYTYIFAQIKAVLNQPELIDTPAVKTTIEYKWEKFAKNYFLLKCLFHTLYSFLFITSISIRDDFIKKITMFIVLIYGAFSLLVGIIRLKLIMMKSFKIRNLFEAIYVIILPSFYFARTILPMIVAKDILFNDSLSSGLVGTSMLFIYMSLVRFIFF